MVNTKTYDYHNPDQTGRPSPYGSGDPYYSKSSGYIASGAAPAKSSKKNWLKIGIPIAVIVIVGAVIGGVLLSFSSLVFSIREFLIGRLIFSSFSSLGY